MSSDNLQVLGGVLIVLSIFLLWCWCSKKGNMYDEGMIPRAAYALSNDEGLSNRNAIAKDYIGGLKFKEAMWNGSDKVPSMHDLENMHANRHLDVQRHHTPSNVVGLKWNSDGMVGINTLEADMRDGDDIARRQLNIGGDIYTPMPHDSVAQSSNTPGGAILTLTDFRPVYGNAVGNVSV
jgi:hypothetical protein